MSINLKLSRFTCSLSTTLVIVYRVVIVSLLCLNQDSLVGQEIARATKVQHTLLTSPDHLSQHALTVYANEAKKWDNDVLKLSSQNAMESNENAILFIGSSTIRLWDSIEHDVAPYRTIKRGYGGAKFCDLAIHCPALIKGLNYRAAVVFVANDITGSTSDKEPVEIKRLARLAVDSLKANNPSAPVILLSITATPSRFAHWGRIQSANRTLCTLANEIPGVYFLETETHYLSEHGKPIDKYFVEDRLHQTPEGYRLLGSLVKSKLDDVLNANVK